VAEEARLSREAGRDGAVRLWFVRGLADGVAVRELYEAVAVVIDEPSPRVVVDFTGVEHVSSGMLGMLVTATKKVRQAGGRVAVVMPDERVREQVVMTRLHLVFDVHAGLDEAYAAWRQ
jgi:anti-sigma B factor antagonist